MGWDRGIKPLSTIDTLSRIGLLISSLAISQNSERKKLLFFPVKVCFSGFGVEEEPLGSHWKIWKQKEGRFSAKFSGMKFRDGVSNTVVPPSGQGTKCPSLYKGPYFIDKRLRKDFQILHSLYFYHEALENQIKKYQDI